MCANGQQCVGQVFNLPSDRRQLENLPHNLRCRIMHGHLVFAHLKRLYSQGGELERALAVMPLEVVRATDNDERIIGHRRVGYFPAASG